MARIGLMNEQVEALRENVRAKVEASLANGVLEQGTC